MTDDDLEWRLHAMLDERADRIEPTLTGPELRRRSGTRQAHRPRRAAAMLAAAAVVAGVAVATADYARDNGPRRPTGPVPGGGVSAPARTEPISPAPSRASSVARSAPSVTPSASSAVPSAPSAVPTPSGTSQPTLGVPVPPATTPGRTAPLPRVSDAPSTGSPHPAPSAILGPPTSSG